MKAFIPLSLPYTPGAGRGIGEGAWRFSEKLRHSGGWRAAHDHRRLHTLQFVERASCFGMKKRANSSDCDLIFNLA